MLDQSFSTKNFKEIFDGENRKGKNLEKKFNGDFLESIRVINDLKITRKDILRTTDSDEKKALYKRKGELKKLRELKVFEILDAKTERINSHKVLLNSGSIHGKQCFIFEEKVENFFISKKIQDNINKTYDVKQSSRYAILSNLVNILEDKFPKYVIRTDIKDFYESIPQKKLLNKINDDHLLSVKSKDFINQIFDSYNVLTNQSNDESPKGVPRGIGVSAYLSELFMRRIDNQIKELRDLVFYARYVDDIIAVFIPRSKNNEYYKEYLKSIKKIIKEKAGDDFIINDKKTKEYNLLNGINYIKIEEKYYLD
ncbi:reverse transcriptase, partial [Emticicia sp. CRIBPO]|uniref:antiviral reverse transcriptase Drt3a n=1 Tax=Emticicia sp. CRIBPO TaxID=2683258 RepID=UPI00141217C5